MVEPQVCRKGDRQAPCHPAPGLALQSAGILPPSIRQLAQKRPGCSQCLQMPQLDAQTVAFP